MTAKEERERGVWNQFWRKSWSNPLLESYVNRVKEDNLALIQSNHISEQFYPLDIIWQLKSANSKPWLFIGTLILHCDNEDG